MISEKVELERVMQLIKKEIESSEMAKKILELDSKLVELKKAVEGIVIELTYIKSEIKELRESGKEKKATLQPKESEKTLDRIEEKIKAGEARVDVIKRGKVETERKVEKICEAPKLDEKDLIICD